MPSSIDLKSAQSIIVSNQIKGLNWRSTFIGVNQNIKILSALIQEKRLLNH